MPPLDLDHILSVGKMDAWLVNFITGFEMSIETFQQFREQFMIDSCPMFFQQCRLYPSVSICWMFGYHGFYFDLQICIFFVKTFFHRTACIIRFPGDSKQSDNLIHANRLFCCLLPGQLDYFPPGGA